METFNRMHFYSGVKNPQILWRERERADKSFCEQVFNKPKKFLVQTLNLLAVKQSLNVINLEK